MKNNNIKTSKAETKENKISLVKRKEAYETSGIPVDRLFYCCGLPMTSSN